MSTKAEQIAAALAAEQAGQPSGDAVGCDDCGRPYGDEHGFPDLIVPNYIWRQISPTKDNGGLLCPSCICKRLSDAGIREVEGSFMSGPIRSVDSVTMHNARWIENLREQGHGWSCPDCGRCRDKCEHTTP